MAPHPRKYPVSTPGSRWKTDPRGPYIRLYSGQKFYLKCPEENAIRVSDVAYHLAGTYRYSGGSRYSVAQHCVVAAAMAEYFYPDHPELPAKMLVHDVAEYVLGDVSAPLKSLLPEYQWLEARTNAAVERRFGVRFTDDPLVKEIDDRMWLTEKQFIYIGDAHERDYEGDLVPFDLSEGMREVFFEPWNPRHAEREWKYQLAEYLPDVKGL